MYDDNNILVHEVGTRDGLQSIQTVFSTDGKMNWIRQEAAAGVRQIQVGSFVSPKLLPQMADTAEVVRQSIQIPGLTVSALVPNLRGAANAMAAGVHQVGVVMSVSEAHNQANIRRTVQESLNEFEKIIAHRNANPAYKNIVISGGMATSFGCTISGKVPLDDVIRVAEELLTRGADRIGVADTVGYANPTQARTLFTKLYEIIGDRVPVGAHFHDTRGLGLANVFAALDAGVREFDSSLAGLGGCPYAPGASGNIVTEDLVFMLESMGLSTGINLDGLLEARAILEHQLQGEPVHGTYVMAGAPKGFADT